MSTTKHTLTPGALCYYNSIRGPVRCRVSSVAPSGHPSDHFRVVLEVDKENSAYPVGHVIETYETWCIPYQALKRDGIHIRPYTWKV